MVVGFNHNFRYKGEVYHIQTEDSGVKSPNIVTLLYQGGTILASKKTSYADIAKVNNLEQVVEELMKEQHKDMLRCLKAGEFDSVIERFKAGKQVTPQVTEGEKVTAPPPPAAEQPPVEKVVERPVEPPVKPPVVADKPPVVADKPPVVADKPPVVADKPPVVADKPKPVAVPPVASQPKPSAVEASLDEVILSYLMGDDK